MNYYYITGTSSGIGKEISVQLLQNPSNRVIGISHTTSIFHPNYNHILLDLSNTNNVSNFEFSYHPDAEKICLINNAGTLGKLGKVGSLNSQTIIETYNINVIAPSILCNSFIRTYNSAKAEKIILNMSSGAGKNPVDGWGVYCASKAAMDMFTRVVEEEQTLITENDSQQKNGFKIIAVAPGKVDTNMQSEIRNSTPQEFSSVQNFIDFKANDQLLSPKAVAKKYIEILENTCEIKQPVFSLKDFGTH